MAGVLHPILGPAEITASLEVCAAADVELGDPFGWCDFAAHPDATVAAVQARLRDRRTPRRAQEFRWPKEKAAEYRPMAWLDHLDQLVYRGAVGRLVPAVATALDPKSVFSFRLADRRRGFELAPWWHQNRPRRERAKALLDEHPVMGAIDIRNFYPSVRPEAVTAVYANLPVPERTVSFLTSWLDELHDVSGVRGLPIGHDGSSVLSHGLLLPADGLLHDLGIPFVRWVDDVWFFVDDLAAYDQVIEMYGRQLGLIGLELHPTKTRPLMGAEALDVIENSAIQYLGDVLDDPGPDGELAGLSLFEYALWDPSTRQTETRKALTTLTRYRSLAPLTALKDDTDLLRAGIRNWVTYLRVLLSNRDGRRAVGDDWLLGQITRPVTKNSGYKNVCFLRAASQLQLPKPAAQEVFALTDSDGGWSAPIRVWATHVWGRSDAFSPGVAVEQVEEQGEFSTRRAFACTLSRKRGDDKMRRWATQVRRAEPELEATARWLEAA